jgi:hypothetical protein
MYGAAIAVGALFSSTALAQSAMTDTSRNPLSVSIPFSNLTPGKTSTAATTQVQILIRSKNVTGYHIEASASFIATTSSPAAGGTTITASDIGVGISALAYGASVLTPRTDTIPAAYNYNPGTVTAINGLTPFGGATGRATLADIIASPNITILRGPKIANNDNVHPDNTITVTMTFGLLAQFFTPSTLSGTITLTFKDGP